MHVARHKGHTGAKKKERNEGTMSEPTRHGHSAPCGSLSPCENSASPSGRSHWPSAYPHPSPSNTNNGLIRFPSSLSCLGPGNMCYHPGMQPHMARTFTPNRLPNTCPPKPHTVVCFPTSRRYQQGTCTLVRRLGALLGSFAAPVPPWSLT